MASGEMLLGQDLALVRGGRLLFEGLNLTLGRGEALLITGRNGAGKSSLLRVVAGLLEPDAGKLENPFKVSILSSDQALKSDNSVRSELDFWARLDEATPEAVLEAIDLMAIEPLLDFRCGQLSSGQRQRVAIARTFFSGADLWLLDEPTNALDSASESRLLQAIALHRSQGGLIMVATHQPMPLPQAKSLSL